MFANADLDAGAGARTNRRSAVALRKRTVGSQRGESRHRVRSGVIGVHASAVMVGHLARAGPPRAARALVESRLRGGEEGEKHGE